MATLSISKFSCIEGAQLTLSPMTVLIGPQASGKSVISKLYYFFLHTIHKLSNYGEELMSAASLIGEVEAQFCRWFPPSAWGDSPFAISFVAGQLEISVRRRRSKKGPSDKVTVVLSAYLVSYYAAIVEGFTAARAKQAGDKSVHARDTWELSFNVRRKARDQLSADLGTEYVDSQLFVPAGRSFFTSIGKAVAAFEHGGLLDPATVQFGRLFSFWKEDFSRGYRLRDNEPDITRDRLMVDLFGGEIKFERDREFVQTTDGRQIPFSILSSGQQELLPLWMALRFFVESSPVRSKELTSLVYIEEPEAHLFPSAQSSLLQYLASIVAQAPHVRRMLITTHSPYVLTKLNNLMLAGSISPKNTEAVAAASKITPRRSWLRREHVSAYAIVGRRLENIVDSEGLIDGGYLDSVSGNLSDEFLSLLEISESR